MSQEEYQKIILSSLLHDIGKFWQRTGEAANDSRACDEITKHKRFRQCDKCLKKFGYSHAALAQVFFEDYISPLWKRYGGLAPYHHTPPDHLSKIVALADRLSAMEREKAEEEETEEQLLSIFARIQGKKKLPEEKHIGLKTLSLERKVLFPSAPLLWVKEPYTSLWRNFIKELSQINEASLDFTAYINNIYYLLQKYTGVFLAPTMRQSLMFPFLIISAPHVP